MCHWEEAAGHRLLSLDTLALVTTLTGATPVSKADETGTLAAFEVTMGSDDASKDTLQPTISVSPEPSFLER